MATEPIASGDGGGQVAASEATNLTAQELSEKVGELEERARRLAGEELEELLRGRALNIIAGAATPMKPPVAAAATPTAAVGPKTV